MSKPAQSASCHEPHLKTTALSRKQRTYVPGRLPDSFRIAKPPQELGAAKLSSCTPRCGGPSGTEENNNSRRWNVCKPTLKNPAEKPHFRKLPEAFFLGPGNIVSRLQRGHRLHGNSLSLSLSRGLRGLSAARWLELQREILRFKAELVLLDKDFRCQARTVILVTCVLGVRLHLVILTLTPQNGYKAPGSSAERRSRPGRALGTCELTAVLIESFWSQLSLKSPSLHARRGAARQACRCSASEQF